MLGITKKTKKSMFGGGEESAGVQVAKKRKERAEA